MHEDLLLHVPKFNNLDIITRKPFYGPCRMFVAMPLYHVCVSYSIMSRTYRALIDFCADTPEHPRLMFIPSLSSITALSGKKTVPETIVSDPSAPPPMGYGESKYVAEHVLNRATEASRGAIPTAILSVGQIAGPVKSSKQPCQRERGFLALCHPLLTLKR
jgi:hypothetical protein